jgi:tetratricopeptide (TPR) repeat protein
MALNVMQTAPQYTGAIRTEAGQKSKRYLEKSLEIIKKSDRNSDAPLQFAVLFALGEAFALDDQKASAEAYFQKALDFGRIEACDIAPVLERYASFLLDQKRLNEADKLMEEAGRLSIQRSQQR